MCLTDTIAVTVVQSDPNENIVAVDTDGETELVAVCHRRIIEGLKQITCRIEKKRLTNIFPVGVVANRSCENVVSIYSDGVPKLVACRHCRIIECLE